MPKWKLVIEYQGTRYRGWQEQAHARSVQGELRKAAEDFIGREVEIVGSGRTDAGVHALGQVAHLRSSMPLRPAVLCRELNDRLPADINIRALDEVPARFHARHHAEERYYLYQISTRRTAFGKPFVWWIKDRLDIEAMARAEPLFVGRRDFAAYSEKADEPSSTLVEVTCFRVVSAGDLVLLRIGASHFLWKMVRRIVGAVVELGRGSISIEQLGRLSAADAARWTAPPSGLFLEYVRYAGDPPVGPLAPAVLFR